MVYETKGKAQSEFVPARSSWCSSILNSVNCAFELQLSLEWRFGDGPDKLSLSEGSHFFATFFMLLRICSDPFFVIPNFAWLFLFWDYDQRDAPVFLKSLL